MVFIDFVVFCKYLVFILFTKIPRTLVQFGETWQMPHAALKTN